MTGTLEYCASSATMAWANVRTTMAAENPASDRAVSAIVSPRPSCSSSGRSHERPHPQPGAAPANETRVRVDGFSK